MLLNHIGIRGQAKTPNFQQWTGFAPSPLDSNLYPYQAIVHTYYDPPGHTYRLLVSPTKIYWGNTSDLGTSGAGKMYKWNGSVWVSEGDYTGALTFNNSISPFVDQCNNDVYTDASLTTVRKAKTT